MPGTRDGKTDKKELVTMKKRNKMTAIRTVKEREIVANFIEKHGRKFCSTCGMLRDIKNFRRRLNNKPGYRSACIDCARDKNREYRNTERGFLIEIWNSIKKRATKKDIEITINSFEEFNGLWEKQKSERGLFCPYTGMEMSMEHLQEEGQTNAKRIQTNVSVDRIDTNKGYTPHNILFCTWYANNMKNNITYEVARNFIKEYLLRYYE